MSYSQEKPQVIQDKQLQKAIRFEPHAGQEEVLKSVYGGKRDIRIAAGTRWGKSKLCAYLVLRRLLVPNQRIWVVAPSYDLTQRVLDHLIGFISNGIPALKSGISTRVPQQVVNSENNSWVKCKSADTPQSLLGEEIDLAIVDEVSRLGKDVWDAYLYGRLTSRQGKSVMISTPFGQNWFFREWMRAKNSKDGISFQFPSNSNPHFPPGEWERAKERLPEKIFLQEYCASFEPESAGIFTGIRECISGGLEDAVPGRQYIMGVDLGKLHDFTVLTVVDKKKRHVVYIERFQSFDWKFQEARIKAVAERYNKARVWIDATGKGDPVVDQLLASGFMVDPYKIDSNKPKRNLIEKLSMFISGQKITYPHTKETDFLIDELEACTYKLTESGSIQYGAPAGLHDDGVISLALAIWGLTGREKDMTPIQEELVKIQRENKRTKLSYK